MESVVVSAALAIPTGWIPKGSARGDTDDVPPNDTTFDHAEVMRFGFVIGPFGPQ